MRSAFRNHSEHMEYKNRKIWTGSEVNSSTIRLYDRWERFFPCFSEPESIFVLTLHLDATCFLWIDLHSAWENHFWKEWPLWVLQLVCGRDVGQFRALPSEMTQTSKSSSAPLGHRRAYWGCQPFFLLATFFIRLINSWIVEKQLLWGGFS